MFLIYEADVTAFVKEINKLNEIKDFKEKIKLNTVLMKVIIEGILANPEINAHIAYNKWLSSGSITRFDNIDINMPVLINDKMVTIKLPNFEGKSLIEMTNYINLLIEKLNNTNINIVLTEVGLEDTLLQIKKLDFINSLGRILGSIFGKNRILGVTKEEMKKYRNTPIDQKVSKEDLNIGTVTISNIGALIKGTSGTVALIDLVTPQIFAVGIGALQELPQVYKDGEEMKYDVKKIISFCIVFDHRALDFGEIAPFINKIDEVFKNPEVIHKW